MVRLEDHPQLQLAGEHRQLLGHHCASAGSTRPPPPPSPSPPRLCLLIGYIHDADSTDGGRPRSKGSGQRRSHFRSFCWAYFRERLTSAYIANTSLLRPTRDRVRAERERLVPSAANTRTRARRPTSPPRAGARRRRARSSSASRVAAHTSETLAAPRSVELRAEARHEVLVEANSPRSQSSRRRRVRPGRYRPAAGCSAQRLPLGARQRRQARGVARRRQLDAAAARDFGPLQRNRLVDARTAAGYQRKRRPAARRADAAHARARTHTHTHRTHTS